MDAEERNGNDGQTTESAAGSRSQSILLSAGRLEAQLGIRPEQQIGTTSSDIVAWSIDNLIAIVDSTLSIKLVHLGSPHQSQSITIQERPYLLSFSPRGDALFAAFASSKTCCLWTRARSSLNEWKLSHNWADWQGKVLDLQWLGAAREWESEPRLSRKAAKGPQFAAEEFTHAVGAVAICEGGQIIQFCGSIGGEVGWETQANRIPIPTQQKVAKAAIGLVPDEPMAIIAYTLRLSSKAILTGSNAEGDALGMFFEGADGAAPLDEQQDSHYLDDGQDKIELVEVRLDLAASPLTIGIRPLWPIFLSSYDSNSLPFASSLTRLMWINADEKGGEGGAGIAKMKLFGGFYAKSATTMRVWEIQREEMETLSGAFAKLEAAKSKANEEEREDWIVSSESHQTYADYIGNHYIAAPNSKYIVCSWTYSPRADSLSNIVKLSNTVEFRLVDMTSLQLSDENALPNLQSRTCLPALSPSGTLAAQVCKDRVSIVEASPKVRWSSDDSKAYWPAVLESRDLSDVLRSCPCDLSKVSASLGINEGSFQQVVKLVKIAAQMDQAKPSIRAKNSRMLLELTECFQNFKLYDKGSYFDHHQLWALLTQLEWLIWTLEKLAKQAYLEHATTSVSSPPENSVQAKDTSATATSAKGEVDLLTLMTKPFARKVVIHLIAKSIKFCNWIHRMNRSKEQVKGVMSNVQFRETFKVPINNQRSGNGLWSFADNLRLAQMRVNEVMLKSAIDLSQFGRFFKSYKSDVEGGEEEEKEESSAKWWATLDSGNRAKMAKAIVEGQCIRNALFLFCPEDEEGEGEVRQEEQRDILTKAKLNAKAQSFVCLCCKGKTQLPLAVDQKCICGSGAWWSTMR